MLEKTWYGWGENWPDWKDDGRLVEFYTDNGNRLVSGHLAMDEFGPDCIIISIKDGTGKGESFVDSDKWRYCDA